MVEAPEKKKDPATAPLKVGDRSLGRPKVAALTDRETNEETKSDANVQSANAVASAVSGVPTFWSVEGAAVCVPKLIQSNRPNVVTNKTLRNDKMLEKRNEKASAARAVLDGNSCGKCLNCQRKPCGECARCASSFNGTTVVDIVSRR